MTFNKLLAWQSSLDHRFRRLPIVVATALVCTSLQAAPVIDFNGQSTWNTQVEDGAILEHISVVELDENKNHPQNFDISVGDGNGTLYFGKDEGKFITDKSLIQNYSYSHPIKINVKGNISINNVDTTKKNTGFIVGLYRELENHDEDEYYYRGTGSFSLTGDLTIKNSTSLCDGVYISSQDGNTYEFYESNISFGNINISDTSVVNNLFATTSTNFSAKDITVTGSSADIYTNESFTTIGTTIVSVFSTENTTVGNIKIENVFGVCPISYQGGSILTIASENGNILTGNISISNSVTGSTILGLGGRKIQTPNINISDIRIVDWRADHPIEINSYGANIGNINVNDVTFDVSRWGAYHADQNLLYLSNMTHSVPNPMDSFIISNISINNIQNKSEKGDDHTNLRALKIEYSKDLNLNNINISNIKSFDDTEHLRENRDTTGILSLHSNFSADSINIYNINGLSSSLGIAEIDDLPQYYHSSMNIQTANINQIKGKYLATAVLALKKKYDNNRQNTDTSEFKNLTISNVESETGQSFGLYTVNKNLNSNNLSISNVKGREFSSAIATNNTTLNVDNLQIYNPSTLNKSSEKRHLAIYSKNSSINVKEAIIDGDIIANNSNLKLGKPSTNSKIHSDLFALNNSVINIDLNSNSEIIGSIDDFWCQKSARDQILFSPGELQIGSSNLEPSPLAIESSGTANLTLNGGTWHATGESFVTNLTFGDQGGTLDLRSKGHYDVLVKNLKGNGQVHMLFGTNEQDAGGLTHTDMLYVQNLDENAKLTIYAHPDDSVTSLEDLNGLHFATTNKTNGGQFNVVLQDQGFLDLNLPVTSESYDPNSALNEAYNGHGNGDSEKPGDAVIDDIFQNGGTNWVIQTDGLTPTPKPEEPKPDPKPEPQPQPDPQPQPQPQPQPELSTVGSTLLATARSNYWTAVEMDRLNKRLGDARYANGDDGVWLRMRYESNGTNSGYGDFESDAVTYQLGFDHAFKRNNGRWIVGGAVDYKDADVDYKSITGEGSTDRLGLKVYGTWLGDNGAYVDVNAIWGNLSNKFDIVNGLGEKIKADYDNHIMGVSAETGHRFTLANGFFAEPQMQLQYLRVTDANYSTSQGTRMVHKDFDSVISRVGLRSGMSFGQAKEHTVYAKADWMHEWAGDQKIKVYDVTTSRSGFDASIDNKGSWYDVGFGAQAKLSDASYGFVDMEYRFGNSLDKSWVVNAGVRYAF